MPDLHAVYVVDTRRHDTSMLEGSGDVLDDLEDRGQKLLDEREMRTDADLFEEIRYGRPIRRTRLAY